MNKILPFFILIFLNQILAQDFKELTVIGEAKMLDPIEYQARRLDPNGKYCAAIQIISDINDFYYDSYYGTIGEKLHKPGSDIVYLIASERTLNVSKTGYKSLKLSLSELEISLEPGQVWQLSITSKTKIKPLIVTVQFYPTDATLYIDDEVKNGDTHILSHGEHSILITKEGFFPIEETIIIDEKNVFFEWQLYQDPELILTDTLRENPILNSDPNMIEMILVKGGSFMMGCTSEQNDCADEEEPAHNVILDDFLIGKYEVTVAQWNEVLKKNKILSDCNDCPAANISWDDVKTFLAKLKNRTGKKYRLPTEAEWEYAARGGQQSTRLDGKNIFPYSGSFKIEDVAWFTKNSNYNVHPVGQKSPNELGIYDMSGNVWEWCNDRYLIDYYKESPEKSPKGPNSYLRTRVLRGGSWDNYAWRCRTASRYSESPEKLSRTMGFRLALDKK